MVIIITNSEHNKTSNPDRLFLNLTDKSDLRREKSVALSNLCIYYPLRNIKGSYKNNKFGTSVSTWVDKCHIPDRTYFILDNR